VPSAGWRTATPSRSTGTPRRRDRDAGRELADLLANHGGPRPGRADPAPIADAGRGYAAEVLARLLADRGDLDQLSKQRSGLKLKVCPGFTMPRPSQLLSANAVQE
jgi:hypothetical protein